MANRIDETMDLIAAADDAELHPGFPSGQKAMAAILNVMAEQPALAPDNDSDTKAMWRGFLEGCAPVSAEAAQDVASIRAEVGEPNVALRDDGGAALAWPNETSTMVAPSGALAHSDPDGLVSNMALADGEIPAARAPHGGETRADRTYEANSPRMDAAPR
mgnify:CR=1 FL=1